MARRGEMAASCNGCGQCRTEMPGQPRMCPIFRAGHDEAATPRAKANLMRHLLDPRTDPRALSSGDVRGRGRPVRQLQDVRRECPAHVNIPKLMLEAKAANVAQYGMDRTEWALARTELFARLGSSLAPLANAFLANGIARWMLERLLGISRLRRLPALRAAQFPPPGLATRLDPQAALSPAAGSPTSSISSPTTTTR